MNCGVVGSSRSYLVLVPHVELCDWFFCNITALTYHITSLFNFPDGGTVVEKQCCPLLLVCL